MKAIKISELKAKLARYLRFVKQGQEIVVLDRNLPVAMITPIPSATGLLISEAQVPFNKAAKKFFKLTGKGKTDSLSVLLEDRNVR